MSVLMVRMDTLGDLGEALERHFGSDIQAIVLVRRSGDAPLTATSLPRRTLATLPHPRRDVVEPVARRLVDMLGVPSHVRGRNYIVECLVQIAEVYPDRPKTTSVYADTAKRFPGATASRVERALRHAIELAEKRDPSKFASVVGHGDHGRARPTNSEVLYRLLELLDDDLRGGRP